MAMYINDNLTHEEIYDSNKHDIAFIEEQGLYDIFNYNESIKIWRILVFNKDEYNYHKSMEDIELIEAMFTNQIISVYYDPYCIFGCEKGPYFEVYDSYSGCTERFTFKEYKKMYNAIYKIYKSNIMI